MTKKPEGLDEREYAVTIEDAQMISVGEDVYPVLDGKVSMSPLQARPFLDAGIVTAIPVQAQVKKITKTAGKEAKQQELPAASVESDPGEGNE